MKTCKGIAGPSIARELRDWGGWSFIETIIVIGISLVLSAAVGFTAVKFLDRARIATAKSDIATLSMALETYAMDCGAFPDPRTGLEALWTRPEGVSASWNGPYLNKRIVKDPWNRPYCLEPGGPDGQAFVIRCLGADGLPGGEGINADVVSGE